jgi:PDZ domain-containing protein
VALFDENVTVAPAPRRKASRGTRIGLWALVVALVALLALTFLPTGYVIQQPGPVYNTLGTVTSTEGEEVPLIAVEGAQTYPTAGALDLLTVQIAGTRQRTPSWFDLALAWFDPSRAVVPIDSVYPEGQTPEERNEESAAMMTDSQEEAKAAALTELGYDVGAEITVYSVGEDAPAAGILEVGDVIVSAEGMPITDAAQLRELVQESAGAPMSIDIVRGGQEQTVQVTPRSEERRVGKECRRLCRSRWSPYH